MELETRNPKPAPPCPHPAGEQTPLFPAHDYVTGHRFEIVQCRACGLNRTQPQPAAEEWDAYYPTEYFGTTGRDRFPKLIEWLQRRLYAGRVRRVTQLNSNQPGRVLDVGCGRGLLLREFQNEGWEVQGTESSDRAAAYARDVLRLPVRTGDLAGLRLPDDHFDAVVMWHVLEHLPDAQAALAEVARILKPGGIFFVAVANFGSPEARWTKDQWFHLDVPRHLNHFTRPVLCGELAGVGLPAQRISFFAAEYDTFSCVQSALNRFGLRPNLLYNLLRRSGAKLRRARRTPPWQTLATLALAPFFGLLSVPALFVAALIGQGATMTIHARKMKI